MSEVIKGARRLIVLRRPSDCLALVNATRRLGNKVIANWLDTPTPTYTVPLSDRLNNI